MRVWIQGPTSKAWYRVELIELKRDSRYASGVKAKIKTIKGRKKPWLLFFGEQLAYVDASYLMNTHLVGKLRVVGPGEDVLE